MESIALMESIMNTNFLKKIILVSAIGVFSQFAVAQNDGNAAAVKMIADIVVSLNHFPSDDDLDTLDQIIANSSLAPGVREMANTVASIEHTANEEGRGAMEAIQNNDQAPPQAKALASIIENFSHTASADAKKQLGELFP